MTKTIDYSKTKKYMNRQISRYGISNNSTVFFNKLKKIIPTLGTLEYKRNALLMIEGENGYFEDINLFNTRYNKAQVIFYQVKGSFENNVDKAIVKAFGTISKNPNFTDSSQFFILLNTDIQPAYYCRNLNEKIRFITRVIENMKFFQKISKSKKKDAMTILEDYIDKAYQNPSLTLSQFFTSKTNTQKNQYYLAIFLQNDVEKLTKNLKFILTRTRIIKTLDYRLVYLFLKFQYGNDSLNKLLWNIESKAMEGTKEADTVITNKLSKISFTLPSLVFSKTQNKIKTGRIL